MPHCSLYGICAIAAVAAAEYVESTEIGRFQGILKTD